MINSSVAEIAFKPLAKASEANKVAPKDPKVLQASRRLEGLFITMLLKEMVKTLPGGGLVGKKDNLANWLFTTTMGEALAKRGGLGLGEVFYKALQEKQGELLKVNNLTLAPDIQKLAPLPEAAEGGVE